MPIERWRLPWNRAQPYFVRHVALAGEFPLPEIGVRHHREALITPSHFQLQRTPTRLYVHPSFGLMAKPLRCANVEERCAATTSSPSTTRSEQESTANWCGPAKNLGTAISPSCQLPPIGAIPWTIVRSWMRYASSTSADQYSMTLPIRSTDQVISRTQRPFERP